MKKTFKRDFYKENYSNKPKDVTFYLLVLLFWPIGFCVLLFSLMDSLSKGNYLPLIFTLFCLAVFVIVAILFIINVLLGGSQRRYKGENNLEKFTREFKVSRKEIQISKSIGYYIPADDVKNASYRIYDENNNRYFVSSEMFQNINEGDSVKIQYYNTNFVIELEILKENGERLTENQFISEVKQVSFNAYIYALARFILSLLLIFGSCGFVLIFLSFIGVL